jgi:hypothetical protein
MIFHAQQKDEDAKMKKERSKERTADEVTSQREAKKNQNDLEVTRQHDTMEADRLRSEYNKRIEGEIEHQKKGLSFF